MSPETIFRIHLVAGYAAWLLCFGAYLWPWLKSMDRDAALRAIATLHGFRFFGLVFILPGVVGSGLPPGFAAGAAWGDFATGLLALLALALFRVRPLFRAAVVAFNVVGMADLLLDYAHAVQLDLPSVAGELGSAYAIPVVVVPLLAITHVAALVLLARPARARAIA
ncbi:MAG TPA: hypothetical protein VIP05_20810 [Burkholderiaceae bacterium]